MFDIDDDFVFFKQKMARKAYRNNFRFVLGES